MRVASAAATPIASTTPECRLASAAMARLAGRPTDKTRNAASEIPNATVTTRLKPAGRHPAAFSGACARRCQRDRDRDEAEQAEVRVDIRTVSTEVSSVSRMKPAGIAYITRKRHDPDRQHRGGGRSLSAATASAIMPNTAAVVAGIVRVNRSAAGVGLPGDRRDRVAREPRELGCEAPACRSLRTRQRTGPARDWTAT